MLNSRETLREFARSVCISSLTFVCVSSVVLALATSFIPDSNPPRHGPMGWERIQNLGVADPRPLLLFDGRGDQEIQPGFYQLSIPVTVCVKELTANNTIPTYLCSLNNAKLNFISCTGTEGWCRATRSGGRLGHKEPAIGLAIGLSSSSTGFSAIALVGAIFIVVNSWDRRKYRQVGNMSSAMEEGHSEEESIASDLD